MADRYNLQIKEQSLPNAMMKPAVVSDGGLGAAFGGLAKVADSFTAVALHKQEEFDMLRVEEANNELTKRLLDYTNNPDSGILHTRKLGGAIGDNSVTYDYEAKSKDIVDSVANDLKLSPRQLDSFHRVALNTAMPFYKLVQNHEAREGEAYKKAQTSANIEINTQLALTDPFDQETYNTAWDMIEAGILLELQDAPEQALQVAIDQAKSNLRAAAIAQIAESDPILAFEYLNSYENDLLPEAKAKLTGRLKDAAKNQENFSLAEKYYAKYKDNLPGARDAIYSNNSLSVEDKDRIWSRVKSRHSEALQWENEQEREIFKQQKENLNALFNQYATSGQLVPFDKIEELVANGSISDDGARAYLQWSSAKARRNEMERKERQINPEFYNLPEDEQISILRGKAGVAEDEAIYTYNMMFSKVISGAGDPNELRTAYDMLLINRSELNALDKLHKRIQRAEGLFMGSMQTTLRDTLQKYRNLFGGIESAYINRAAYEFNSAIADMNFNDPKERDEAIKILQKTLFKALDDASEGKEFRDYYLWGLYSTPSLYAKSYKENYEILEKMASDDFLDPEDLVYPREAWPKDSALYPVGALPASAQSMVEGGKPPVHGGRYNAKRVNPDGSDRDPHQAVDIPAKPGSVIKSANFGTDLTVQNIVKATTGSDGKIDTRAGNYVFMNGALPDGKIIDVIIMHMDNNFEVKKDMKVKPDQPIGYVGADPGIGSSGPHMHLQIKIDGKAVNPDEYLASVLKSNRQSFLDQQQRRSLSEILAVSGDMKN